LDKEYINKPTESSHSLLQTSSNRTVVYVKLFTREQFEWTAVYISTGWGWH